MTLVLSDLRTELRDHTGDDSTDLSNASCDLLLNRAYWELLDKFPFREKERRASFSISTGVRVYAAPSPFEAVRNISIADPDDNKHIRLKRMTLEWYENEFDSDTDSRNMPEYYTRHDADFIVYPTPDKAYNGFIDYWTVLSDLSDSNTTPDMPQVWHEIILYGAVHRRFLKLQDLIRAREFRNVQVSLINSISPVEGKEEADSHESGMELPEELTERNW